MKAAKTPANRDSAIKRFAKEIYGKIKDYIVLFEELKSKLQ